MNMKNIKLTIQYDGTNYSGWQTQDNAIGIQQVLTEALERVTGEPVNLIGSGRTDKGVHAYGQVANFRTNTRIRPDKLHYWLKPELPDDIQVIESQEVHWDFHARFDAKSKIYLYRIRNTERMHPIDRNYFELVDYPLDIDRMRRASEFLLGEHDFRGFCGILEEGTNPIRDLDRCGIHVRGESIDIEFEAMSFLRNQVRIMVGTLVEVGRGRLEPLDIQRIFQERDRSLAGPTLSGRGLYLMDVRYE